MKDAVVVLGGKVTPEGNVSQIVKYRVDKAVDLYKKGIAPRLVFSGKISFSKNSVLIKTEAMAMKEYAVSLGIPDKAILLEENSQDTIGNAYFTKINILEPNNWNNITVVTSDYHLSRSKYVFEKILGSNYQIDFVSAPSNLSASELAIIDLKEQAKIALIKLWLNDTVIGDGNDDAIKKILYSKHPAYSVISTISLEDYEQLVDVLSEV